jgi:Peptidase inhibitor family I36
MRSAINGLAMVALVSSVPACAIEPATAASEASKPAIWVVQGAETAASPSTPTGWASVQAAGAPAGAVIFRQDVGVNAPPCPTGFACLFQNSNRGGFGYGLRSGVGNRNLLSVSCSSCTNGIHGNNGTFNDQMSSWENRSGRRYCWYFDVGPSGETHPMANGQLINVLARENDRASAFGPC